MAGGGERDGVRLTSLDSAAGRRARVTKGDLVDYLDAVADRLVPLLAGRPLSVKRVRPGQAPFMQRNVSKGAPDWVRTVAVWSDGAHREMHQVLCDDRRTLLWLANQRAVEFHVPVLPGRGGGADRAGARPRPARGRGLRRSSSAPPGWCRQALDGLRAGAVR